MTDDTALRETTILTAEPRLLALTKHLALCLVSKRNQPQKFLTNDDDDSEDSYFDVKAEGDYLIASYLRHDGKSDSITYKNDRIDEFVAAADQLYTDFTYRDGY